MDYYKQGTLGEKLEEKHHLPEEDAVYYLKQIMNAFKILNSKNIMHRDIKPENILLKDDLVVIADFGCLKQDSHTSTKNIGTG